MSVLHRFSQRWSNKHLSLVRVGTCAQASLHLIYLLECLQYPGKRFGAKDLPCQAIAHACAPQLLHSTSSMQDASGSPVVPPLPRANPLQPPLFSMHDA